MSRVLNLLWPLLCCLAACTQREPLPELASVPDFTLTDQRGEPFAASTLHGQVWIANFIFTRCPDVCPMLTEQMVALRAELGGGDAPVRFVSISVDPGHDTPQVLRDYARAHGAAHDNWHFLTGPLADIEATVKEGFKQAMSRSPDEPENIMHGSHFVLVDGSGTVRGYYRTEPEGLSALADAVRQLAR